MPEMTTLLITGGTGTFGRAFATHALTNNLYSRIVILSRDEKKQSDMRAEFNDSRLRFLLGDVRDVDRLEMALRGVDHIIHAAALKQVDRSALDIIEFINTNVNGTRNVIRVAHKCGVKKLVVLSTDKACASTTPYGATKSLAEWLAIAGNVYGPTRSCATRYGNIVGSRGSVFEIWRQQKKAGQSITVTDERMTRFWMTIDQAVELVLLALNRMRGGEVFIPRDITAVNIMKIARDAFPDAYITETGKRSYEKIHEMLVSPEERDRLRFCGDVYVLLPEHVRWEPGPYGTDGVPVPPDFQYRSGQYND
jgi:UDP-N-acetylglucosamine 4,6-dehydratase